MMALLRKGTASRFDVVPRQNLDDDTKAQSGWVGRAAAAADDMPKNRWGKALLKTDASMGSPGAPTKAAGWDALMNQGQNKGGLHIRGWTRNMRNKMEVRSKLSGAAVSIMRVSRLFSPAKASSPVQPIKVTHTAADRYRMLALSQQAASITKHMDENAVMQAEFDTRRVCLTKKQGYGWGGSTYVGEFVDGVHEDEESKLKRAKLRKLPEIEGVTEGFWEACLPEMGRVQFRKYLDYHLCCYHYIAAKEGDQVDLVEAFDNAITDWLEDTSATLQNIGKRELAFDGFKDSIYELVDLYTPTLDEKQYVKYFKLLLKQCTKTDSAGKRVLRYTWPAAPHGCKMATKLIHALTEGFDEEEMQDYDVKVARVDEIFKEWHGAQTEADGGNEVIPVETGFGVIESGEDTGMAAEKQLTLSGFTAKVIEILELVRPLSSGDASSAFDTFRRFDVRMTGRVTLSDFRAVLLDGTRSEWMPMKHMSSKSFNLGSSTKSKLAVMGTAKVRGIIKMSTSANLAKAAAAAEETDASSQASSPNKSPKRMASSKKLSSKKMALKMATQAAKESAAAEGAGGA